MIVYCESIWRLPMENEMQFNKGKKIEEMNRFILGERSLYFTNTDSMKVMGYSAYGKAVANKKSVPTYILVWKWRYNQ